MVFPLLTPMEYRVTIITLASSVLFSCRAKLEEASERMERVVTAFEGESCRPSPKTIERVLLRGGVSPALKHAVESGQISTRRRAARDLRPVPYPQL